MHERRTWGRSIKPGSSGVEFGPDGVTPVAVKIFDPGENKSTKGSVFFTARSAELIMTAFKERGMPLMWDYEHESTVPLEQRPVSASAGFGEASAHHSELELRGADGAGVDGFDQALWAIRIEWTDDARCQIVSGKRRQVSPAFDVERGTREIVGLASMALCFEGATNNGRILSPLDRRLHSRGQRMEQIIAALRAAIEAGDWEQVKAVLASLEQAGGGMDMTAVRAAVDESVDKAVQTAFKKHSALAPRSGETEAVRLAREAGERATLEVRKERVAALIDRNADVISKETEQFLLSRGDVDLAKALFAELGRTDRKRSGAQEQGGSDRETVTLSAAEQRHAAANGVDPVKMASARERMNRGRSAAKGGR